MMAREEYIRIYRSSVPGATPSLTSGEIAANLVDGKLFVGATNADGSLRNVVFNDVRASVASIGVGHGLSASGSTGTITLYNMGVTSFNGLTGTVNYYPPFATDSVTGVAAFNNKEFGIVSGVVSSRGVTGISAGNTGIAIDGATGEVVVSNLGVLSFNGSTGHISVSIGQTVTGDAGALRGADNSHITARLATTGASGVASFNARDFSVGSTGHVRFIGITVLDEINTNSQPMVPGAGNGIKIAGGHGVSARLADNATLTVFNTGVTSFNGATGTINYYPPIANSSGTGLAYFRPGDFNVSATGAVTLDSAVVKGSTGNTLVSGIAAGVSSIAGNIIAINNLGVTGIAVAANHGLSASGITGTITLRNMGVTGVSANTNSGITISGTTGHVVFALANTGFSLRDDSQQSSTVSLGDTLTITGGTGVVFRKTSEDNYAIYSNFTINGAPPNGNDFTVQTDGKLSIPFATSSVTGVASFPLADFDVSNTGQVSLTGNVARTNTTNTFTQLQTLQGGITGTTATFRFGDIDFIYAQQIGLSSNASGLAWYGGDNRAYPPFIGFPQSGDDTIHIVGGGIVRIGNPSSLGPEYPGNAGGIVINNGTLSIEDITTINGAVRTVNGLDNNITLTGDSAAILGRGTTFSARLATDSLTGVASFPPTFFSVADGAVSLSGGIGFRDSFNITDVVNYNETFTLTGFGSNSIQVEGAGNNTFRFKNLGVTSFNGQAGAVTYYPPIASVGATGVAAFRDSNFDVSGTGAVSIKSGGVPNAALANSSVTVSAGTGLGGGGSVSLGNTVTLTNRGVTSFNGLTGAVTLTGDGGAVRGVNNNAITARIVDCNGASGVVAFDCSIFTINNGVVTGVRTINPGAACESCAATAANSTECDACQGLGCNCQFFADFGGGGVCVCNPIAFDGNGFASEYDVNGNLAALYLDINNLNSYTGSFASKTNNYVLFFDSDEAGTIKTKKASLKTFFLNNLDTLLESKTTSQFTRTKGGDSIEFATVLGAVQAGEQGLVKGASAHDYITKNTVASVDGCTGPIEITGTVNEVTVTTSCPTITVGLPDHIVLTSIAATGATFTGNLKVNGTLGLQNGQTITSAVTTFNGLSGSVSYYPGFASVSATGVASFSSTNFDVSGTGVVTIKSSGVPNAALANSSFTLRDEVGSTDTISLGDTLTITGGRGVDFIRTATDTYEVRGVTATSSVLGVASFNSADFTIASGAVSLTNAARTNAANTFTGLQTFSGGITTTDGFFSFGLTFADNLRSFNPQYFDLSSDRFTLLNVGGSLIQFGMTSAAGIIINNDGEATVTLIGDIIGATGATFGGTVTATRFRGTVSGGSF